MDNVPNIIEQSLSFVKEKLTSPRSLLIPIAWLVWNWDLVYFLLANNYDVSVAIWSAKQHFLSLNEAIVFPAGTYLLLVILWALIVFAAETIHKNLNARFQIFLDDNLRTYRLITKEQFQQLHDDMNDFENYFKNTDTYQEIKSLKEQLSKQSEEQERSIKYIAEAASKQSRHSVEVLDIIDRASVDRNERLKMFGLISAAVKQSEEKEIVLDRNIGEAHGLSAPTDLFETVKKLNRAAQKEIFEFRNSLRIGSLADENRQSLRLTDYGRNLLLGSSF